MKKIYILLLAIVFISCYKPIKSYFNIVSQNKENGIIKVVVEAKTSGKESENIFLITQFFNNNDVIVNTSMYQIGPMMLDAGKYEFNVSIPTNSFIKYTNFIEEIIPERAERVARNGGFANSFFTYMMIMNLMDNKKPVYYDDYGSRRTINRDYYDNRYTTKRSTGRSSFESLRTATKKNTINNNDNNSQKRRTLFKQNSRSSARKQSIFRRPSTRRR